MTDSDSDAPMRAALEKGLAFLPDLCVRRAAQGFAVSSAAYRFKDGDRAAAYAMRGTGETWCVEDTGDLFAFRVDLDTDGVADAILEAKARLEDYTLIIGPLEAEAVPAAIVQMLALVMRLTRDFPVAA